MLLLDDYHISIPHSSTRAKDIARRFIRDSMSAGDAAL
jgi:hypothetical protein